MAVRLETENGPIGKMGENPPIRPVVMVGDPPKPHPE